MVIARLAPVRGGEALLAASTKDYNRADELLSRAEEAQDRRLRRTEDLAREANEAVSRFYRATATTRAERGELASPG